MKSTFTQSMAWLHTWGGLLFGWLLFAIFVTGTLAVFDREITHWMKPEQHRAQPAGDVLGIAQSFLEREAANADRWNIGLPNEREPTLRLNWRVPDGTLRGEQHARTLDPATGQDLAPRASQGGGFFFRFHFSLDFGRTGVWIVGAATIGLLAALTTGVIIHRRIFRDFFTFRPKSSPQRSWLDAHNATGVLALPFHFMIAFTGLVIFWGIYMTGGVQSAYDGNRPAFNVENSPPMPTREATGVAAPMRPLADHVAAAERLFDGPARNLNIANPGDAAAIVQVNRRIDDRLNLNSDRVAFDGVSGELLDLRMERRPGLVVQRVMAGIHFIQFGDYAVRWLFFIAGLTGCAMMATGVILFSEKRADKQADDPAAAVIYRAVERLNVAAVAGLLVACAAYFWGNRLLPVDMAERIRWEINLFYAVWSLTLLHAALRPPRRAWVEQMSAAAALCLALPILNGLTGGSDLIDSLRHGRWLLAGVDLTALACGGALAWTALRVARKPPARRARRRSGPAMDMAAAE